MGLRWGGGGEGAKGSLTVNLRGMRALERKRQERNGQQQFDKAENYKTIIISEKCSVIPNFRFGFQQP